MLKITQGHEWKIDTRGEILWVSEQEGYGPIDFPALVYNWLHLVTSGHMWSQLFTTPIWSQLVTSGHKGSELFATPMWSQVVKSGTPVASGHSWSHL